MLLPQSAPVPMMTETHIPAFEQELQEVIRRIIESYAPQKIILFGSYAYGRPTPDSDFDLLILKETEEPPRQRRFIVRKIVWPLPINTPVEPIVLTQSELDQRLKLKDQFIQEIVSRGRLLYAK